MPVASCVRTPSDAFAGAGVHVKALVGDGRAGERERDETAARKIEGLRRDRFGLA